MLTQFYRTPVLSEANERELVRKVRAALGLEIGEIETEYCFYVESAARLNGEGETVLSWLLGETFEPERFGAGSFLSGEGTCLEVGPRLSFKTAWCTNAVAVCHSCGLEEVTRIERSRRYLLRGVDRLSSRRRSGFLELVHDRMTECPYNAPLTSFNGAVRSEASFRVPILQEGRAALERLNQEAGLAFDDWDLDYYTDLFARRLGRNPTDVECFDIAQSNSEHSRHWFFKGRMVIGGQEQASSLLELIQEPMEANPRNSVIAFRDNSSAIRGYRIETLLPSEPGHAGPMISSQVDHDIIFTAETHNFPSGVAPFPGAETGTGGRIRDVHATGQGSLVVAGTAAYCVGNLRIPGYELPWEDSDFRYPENLASPLQIEIEASDGASDYGNKFGEPLIQGFTRSFGLRLPDGERREWIKPIMFTGGIGQIDARHLRKEVPEAGMWVVKIGGPAYRIGLGGGAASSMVQGENVAELDFNAVQRGDAEMEQKVNRVIRACVEMGEGNPIVSIHDQGAGGNCNVLKEIAEPAGARIELRKIPVGDDTLSVLEIWVAEYQEQDALLLRPADSGVFLDLCRREKVPAAFVGRVTGDGRIVLFDERDGSTPVDLELDQVLGSMPRKVFQLERMPPQSRPLRLPGSASVREALERVLRLVSVGSKRFLTNKVDRSVTGLVARQQCVGPLQLTLSDVAVIAQSHFGSTGAATAIGERPILGLLDPGAMARMSLAEALTNLVWAPVSHLQDVKCSGNWMWPAKLPGEGARVYAAAVALRDALLELGIAVDGGKDSLSMAALAPLDDSGREETVKAPGALVLSAYVTCPDVNGTVTPDLKLPGQGRLLFLDLAQGRNRLGGSALAQVYGQLGDQPPDLEDARLLGRAFEAVQTLIGGRLVASGHDRSEGGLLTTILEMAFAGDCGVEVDLHNVAGEEALPLLFSEELGLVIEVSADAEARVRRILQGADIPVRTIGRTLTGPRLEIRVDGGVVLEGDVRELRDLWEETSYRIELLQADPDCVRQERRSLKRRRTPAYALSFTPRATAPDRLAGEGRPKVAILREEGSNGDREMASAFHLAGFEAWDVTMSDLLSGSVQLSSFRGVAFVGGFSYADVLDSAKGWAGVIRFNPGLWEQFERFYHRPDSFSLGVCNGCQLMALLGWIPWRGIETSIQPRFVRNQSGRFESRFSTVRIQESPAVMLKGMAGSVLGIWVSHGEGRAFFPQESTLDRIRERRLAPIRYVDDSGRVTGDYPLNPNGSADGIAALCSPDGRHLAMMPHPERTSLKWQWGWMPQDWNDRLEVSPWLRLFQNARDWCGRFPVR
ncbi:MAG: phosphoribosylformylglycinamidine synthase [Candidatus Aminicenantes bacterium]|nr:phosphoribosylformylglycinamidine synthase [Candidatus Aminicenantes bacterium]